MWTRHTIDTNKRDVHVSAMIDGKIEKHLIGYRQVAPAWTMSYRPGNKHRFVNILKHGYCSETCDVNLKNFNVWTQNGECRNVIRGNINGNVNDIDDIWRCGWIDFDWIWIEAMFRNKNMFGVIYDDEATKTEEKSNEKILENSDTDILKSNCKGIKAEKADKNNNENKNKKFGIFQVRVNVDMSTFF